MRVASLGPSNSLPIKADFGWRSALSAAMKALFSPAALATEVSDSTLSSTFSKAHLLAFALLTSLAAWASEPQVTQLWPNGAPGSEGKTAGESVRISPEGDHVVASVHHPSLTVYLPPKEKATGAGVVVIPGGGHRELWMDHEGYRIGQWLSDHGVAGFIVKYRLAAEPGSTYKVERESLSDVQRAIRTVRSHASEWNVDPQRVGVMGFSAGGNLAALAATRYDSGTPNAVDAIDRESSKPAFQALIYPGLPADENQRLSKETPPAFLLCGEDDRPDISQGLPELYVVLKRTGVSAELHIFAGVAHGFGLRDTTRGPVAGWMELFYGWMGKLGYLQQTHLSTGM
jgi:acetyl esterase/lipase